jgi:hypothetical protein
MYDYVHVEFYRIFLGSYSYTHEYSIIRILYFALFGTKVVTYNFLSALSVAPPHSLDTRVREMAFAMSATASASSLSFGRNLVDQRLKVAVRVTSPSPAGRGSEFSTSMALKVNSSG